MIYLRWILCVLLVATSLRPSVADAGATLVRNWRPVYQTPGPNFPSRQRFILIQPIPQPEVSKIAPPSAPKLGQGAQDSVAPSSIDIEKSAPPEKMKSKVSPAEASKKARIDSEHDRLNHNALLWQLERAQAGSGSAMRSIGVRYMEGDGLDKDEAKGREWLKKGADAGDAAAKKILAKMAEADAKKNSEKNKP